MAENLFSVEGLQEILSKITDIDAQLAARSGNENQQRKAVIERLVAENAQDIEKAVGQFVKALEKASPAVVAGVLERFPVEVNEAFKGAIDELVASELKNVSGDVDPDALKATRKELAADFESLKRLLVKSVPESSDTYATITSLEVPRTRGTRGAGAGSKKSGRNKEGYRYSIDGKDRPDSQNSISSVAYFATEKCPTEDGRERWTTQEFKEFIADQGVKFGEDDEWSITLPNGKVVSARREQVQEEASEEETAA